MGRRPVGTAGPVGRHPEGTPAVHLADGLHQLTVTPHQRHPVVGARVHPGFPLDRARGEHDPHRLGDAPGMGATYKVVHQLAAGVHLAAALRDRVVDADVDVFVEGFRAILEVVAARPQAWRLVYGHPDPDVAQYFGAWRRATEQRCAELLRPTLAAWGTVDAEVKLPVLVELWVSAGEGAVRTLLGGTGWTPESLGAVAGAAVFRALRGA